MLIIQKKSDVKAAEAAAKQVDISDKAYKNAWTLLSLGKSNYFDIQNALNTSINAQRQWLQLKRRLDVTNANLQVLFDAIQKTNTNHHLCRI